MQSTTHRGPALYVLGPPKIVIDQSTARLDTRKALALLTYLASHDEEFQRDSLTVLLWPELDQVRGRAALRRTLTPLNKALGREGLLTSRETVALNPDYSLWVDARAFGQLFEGVEAHMHAQVERCDFCIQQLTEAVQLYRGNFMEGFSLRDSAAFDDWQFLESERLQRKFAYALEKLTIAHMLKGELETAIEFGKRWLARDSLQEAAHRALMHLYMQRGDRSAALQQYRACLRILDEELGVPPLDETTRLYEEILENRLPALDTRESFIPSGAPSAGTPVEHPVPMVGRDEELHALQQAFSGSGHRGCFFVLEGEIGIGKTRLINEFIKEAQNAGAFNLTARCFEGERNLAYVPIIAALRSGLALPAAPDLSAALPPVLLQELTRLLPELASRPGFPADDPDQPLLNAQSRIFEAVRLALLEFAHPPTPTVICIDDLQWADPASLEMLAFLVRRLPELPLFILVAWRPEAVPLDHALRQVFSDAVRGGCGRQLVLGRLTREQVRTLSDHFKTPQPALAENLFERTEGLPFFVIEYLKAAADGNLDSIPSGIREIQQSRLARLDETTRQLVTTAAVIGRTFDLETLRSTSGRSEEEAISAIETLVSEGLLVEKPGEEAPASGRAAPGSPLYDFSHETVHQIAYAQTGLARRRLLHRRVAESLLQLARSSEENAGRVADHLLKAGEETRAASYFVQAGDHARRLFANEAALAHYQTALGLGFEDACGLHAAIGDLHTLRGEYRQAVLSYEKSASLAEANRLAEFERKLGIIHHRRGDYPLAASHFESAVASLQKNGADRELQAQIYIDWSRTAAQRGNLERSRELAESGLRLAELEDAGVLCSQAHNSLGIVARKFGALQEARSHLQKALTAAGDNLPSRIAALNNLALVAADESDFTEAIRLTHLALDDCLRIGDRHREAALRNHLADRLHANGEPQGAMDQLKAAVEIFAEIGKESGELEPEIWKLIEW